MNRTKFKAFQMFLALLFALIFAANAFPQNSDAKLTELRKQFAVKYLHPEAHFALARYYLDRKDYLQAFFIMEYARRYRFEEEKFNAALVKFFGDNSPEPSAQAKQNFTKGFEFLKQNDLAEAEKYLVEAANLATKSGFIQGWVGRFFYKAKPDEARALRYYYAAYFLDPHAYETEYVESRIRKIALSTADSEYANLVKSGKSLTEISTNSNPVIVGNAIDQMGKEWKKEYVKPLLECMGNDDSLVRWTAFSVLVNNADASFDKTLAELTADPDLRKRGLAAYALVHRQKEKSFDVIKKMLADDAELIRFDAISALVSEGNGIGIEILKAHLKIETNPTLRTMLGQELQKK